MNAAQEYLASRVLTASPQALHLLVVEGAIRYALQAEAALAAGQAEAADKALEQARTFIIELLNGLDKDDTTGVTANLGALFVFAFRRLAEAEIDRSSQRVSDALSVLRSHRETWRELMEKLQSDPPADRLPKPVPAPESSVPEPNFARRTAPGYEDYHASRSWSG